MKPSHTFAHIFLVIIMIAVLAVQPLATHFDLFVITDGADSVTSASIELPAQPSGDFIIMINESIHQDTMDDWKTFFTGDELPVIFEDVSCMYARGDAAGEQLAERYMLQLPENQMKLISEDPTLLASKIESGFIDMAVLSGEMADAVQLKTDGIEGVSLLRIQDGGEQSES